MNPPPLLRGEQVSRNGNRSRNERAKTDALDCPEDDKFVDVLRSTGECRTNHEYDEPQQEEFLPSVKVGEFPENRNDDGLHYHEGTEHPRVETQAAQIGDYGWACGSHDCHVHETQEQSSEQPP